MNIKNTCMWCDRIYYSDQREDGLCDSCEEGAGLCSDCDELATKKYLGEQYCDKHYKEAHVCQDCGATYEGNLIFVGINAAKIECYYCPPCALKDAACELELTRDATDAADCDAHMSCSMEIIERIGEEMKRKGNQ